MTVPALSPRALRTHHKSVRSGGIIDLDRERAARLPLQGAHSREYYAHAVVTMTMIVGAPSLLLASLLPYDIQPAAIRVSGVLIVVVALALSAFATRMYREERHVE